MFKLLSDWRARLKACLRDRTDLVLENLALRHQLMVLERGRSGSAVSASRRATEARAVLGHVPPQPWSVPKAGVT
jgi:hypothetical protein